MLSVDGVINLVRWKGLVSLAIMVLADLTLEMTSAQVVEMSVTNNSSFQN